MTDDKNIRNLIGDKRNTAVWRQGISVGKECRVLWALAVYSHRNPSQQNILFFIINVLKFRPLLCIVKQLKVLQ